MRAHRLVDAAVDAERQAVAGRGDLVEHVVERVAAPADDMEDRPEHLARQPAEMVDLEGARREEDAVRGAGRQRQRADELAPRASMRSACASSAALRRRRR